MPILEAVIGGTTILAVAIFLGLITHKMGMWSFWIEKEARP